MCEVPSIKKNTRAQTNINALHGYMYPLMKSWVFKDGERRWATLCVFLLVNELRFLSRNFVMGNIALCVFVGFLVPKFEQRISQIVISFTTPQIYHIKSCKCLVHKWPTTFSYSPHIVVFPDVHTFHRIEVESMWQKIINIDSYFRTAPFMAF